MGIRFAPGTLTAIRAHQLTAMPATLGIHRGQILFYLPVLSCSYAEGNGRQQTVLTLY
jgi:hypothetical protein